MRHGTGPEELFDERFEGDLAGRFDGPFEERLTRALETAPVMEVPEDFAARVADRAGLFRVTARGAGIPNANVGRRVAWAGSAVLLVGVAMLGSSSTKFQGKDWLELGLEVEFAALVAWLSLRARLLR